MAHSRSDLDELLTPSSVAVVGASPDSWYSSQLVENLLSYGFDGQLHLVNPNREEAWGRPCHDGLGDLPGPVDLVVVSVPREHVVGIVEEAGELGVPAVLIITAGFGEADETGRELEAELSTAAKAHDVRVCGPNSIGLANTLEGTVLTSTCSRRPTPGGVGLVSHSGALAFTTFFERGADEDIGFAYVVSTGNEVDQTLTDYVEYVGGDEQVDVVATYVEGVDDPRRFMTVAESVTRAGTPVLSVKVGRSETADAAAVSHTGSLTGNDDAWTAAFRQTGVQRVGDVPDLLANARAHAAFDPPDSGDVCVVSTSGGLGSLLADLADTEDLSLPGLPADVERELVGLEGLLTFGGLSNPVDVRGYGADYLPEIAEVLFETDAYAAYVFAIALSAVDERAEQIADDLAAIAGAASDPVFVLWTGRKAAGPDDDGQLPYERLRSVTPVYYDPGRCVGALASLADFGAYRDDAAGRPSREELLDALREAGGGRERDGESDLPTNAVLGWEAAVALLGDHGVDVLSGRVVTDDDGAAAAAAAAGRPVVMKVDSPDIPHRSQVDAVRLGVEGPEEARAAYDDVVANTRNTRPDAEVRGVVVQPQVPDGVEVLVGVSTDGDFGPLVTVASGGRLVEAIGDEATLVPPYSLAVAEDALAQTNVPAVLDERGLSADLGALAALLVDVGDLATTVDAVAELDLNPVVVHGDGVDVVDVLVRTH